MNNSHTFVCHYYYMRMVAGLLNRAAELAASMLKISVQHVQTDRHIQKGEV